MSGKRRKTTRDDTDGPQPKRRKTTNNKNDYNDKNCTNDNKQEYEDKTLPRFLQHIWTMLHDSTLQNMISWHETMPNAFVVHKQNAFCEEILPKYFKHNKFTSFVRQLNMYQFHKLRDEKPMTWTHPYLHKNKYSQLQFIQRRISSSSANNSHSSSTHLQCSNNYQNILQITSANKQKIQCLQQEMKLIRNDINLKFNQLRQDLMAKFDSLYHQNANQDINSNNVITNMRHAPPPIDNGVKTEEKMQTQTIINLDSDSQSTNTTATRYINNNCNTNNSQTTSSVVYVTNGAAQCLPLELIGTAQSATASNASPYIIASHAGSPTTITLLNIGGNNLASTTPPSCNSFCADFHHNHNHYNYNNL